MKIKDYISMIILLSFYFSFWYCILEITSFSYGIAFITVWLISINFNKKIRYTILLLFIILSLILFSHSDPQWFNRLYGSNPHYFFMLSLFLQTLWIFFQIPIWNKKDKEDKMLKSHNCYIYFLISWIWILLLTIIIYLISLYFSPENKGWFWLHFIIFCIFFLPIFITDIIILLKKKVNWKRKIRKIMILNYIYSSLALLITITYSISDWIFRDWIWFGIFLWFISLILYIYLLIFWLTFLIFIFLLLKEKLKNKNTWRKYNYIKLIISWIIMLLLLWYYSYKKYSECFWKQECFFNDTVYLNEQEINELYKPIKYDWRYFFMEDCKEKWWINFVKREFNKRLDTFYCKKWNKNIDGSTYQFDNHHL